MPTGHYLTQEQIDYIRRNFANTPNKELAKSLGISSSAISNIQRKYHLTKSREHTKAMHRLSGLASADSWGKIELTPEVLAKHGIQKGLAYFLDFRKRHRFISRNGPPRKSARTIICDSAGISLMRLT